MEEKTVYEENTDCLEQEISQEQAVSVEAALEEQTVSAEAALEEQTVSEGPIPSQPAEAEQASRKKSGKKVVLTLLCAILAGVLSFTITWFLTADLRLYAQGKAYMKENEYAAALAIFEQIPDHEDSREQIKRCHYYLADYARLREDFDEARQHYLAAEDFQDAAYQVQRMIYSLGHQAFLKEEYYKADAWFEQLEGDIAQYGAPHFKTLEKAAPYLRQQREDFVDHVEFYLGEEPDDYLFYGVKNLLLHQYAHYQYYREDRSVILYSIVYYPGERIFHAWQQNDTSGLTQQEQQVLELALSVVEQGKAQTETQLELQLYLHDWLCKKITYESPNMEVDREEYLQLTELSCIGAMLEGKANCQGYTDAFYLLGNLAGLKVSRLFGITGEGHTWNIVQMDGLWYIVDVTFDDMSDENYDGWNYTYFNTGWDPEVYEIYGGQAVTQELAEDVHPTQNYFAHTENTFTNASDAAYDLVSQKLWEGKKWAYVKIDGTVVDINSFGNTLYNTVARRISWSISWNYWVYDYNGDSYIIVQWN